MAWPGRTPAAPGRAASVACCVLNDGTILSFAMGAGGHTGGLRLALVAAVTLATGLAPASALAGPSRTATDRARELVKRSITEYDLGDFEAALKDATEAFRLDSRPTILYNLGQCERALDHWAKAEFFYRGYLHYVPNAPNRAAVLRLIAQMQKAQAAPTKAAAAAPPPPRAAEERKPAPSRLLALAPLVLPERAGPSVRSDAAAVGLRPSAGKAGLLRSDAAAPFAESHASEPSGRSHALAWTLLATGAAAGAVAIAGAVRVAGFEGTLGNLSPTASAQAYEASIGPAYRGQANAVNWQYASMALGAVAVAALVGGGLAW